MRCRVEKAKHEQRVSTTSFKHHPSNTQHRKHRFSRPRDGRSSSKRRCKAERVGLFSHMGRYVGTKLRKHHLYRRRHMITKHDFFLISYSTFSSTCIKTCRIPIPTHTSSHSHHSPVPAALPAAPHGAPSHLALHHVQQLARLQARVRRAVDCVERPVSAACCPSPSREQQE